MKFTVSPFRSLKTKVTIFTLVILLASIWLLSYYASSMLRNGMQKSLEEQQFSTTSIVAEDINREIDSRLRALEKVAAVITPDLLNNQAALQTILEGRSVFLSLFNGGCFFTLIDGTATASVPLSAHRSGVNYMERDHIAAALKEGRTTISKPVIGKMLHAPVVAMATPVRRPDGSIIGALAGVIDLSKPSFLDKIAGNRYGKSGGFLLVSRQHRLIVTASDIHRVMEKLPPPGANPPIDRFIEGYEGSAVFTNPKGIVVLASAKGVPVAGWYTVAITPVEVAFTPIVSMQQHILAASIFLTLLACGIMWLVLKRQLSPMLDTVKTLSILSDSDLPIHPLPIIRQDEVGLLIGGFNHLLDTLAQREIKLIESEERHRSILHTAINGFWLTDMHGRLLEVNSAYSRMSGFTEQELLTMNIPELVYERTRDEIAARLQAIMVRDEAHYESKHRRKDGTVFDVEVSAQYRSAEGGQYVFFLQDITERKHSSEIVRLNEARLRSLVSILQYTAETTQEFLDNALNEAISLTESTIGYIYFYLEERQEFVLNSWSHDVMKECTVVNPQTIYQLDKTGFWGEAVRQRRPVILNDFRADNQFKKGYPEGHVPLSRFMSVPVFSNDRIVAVVGVANKATDYDEENVLQLTLLMDSVWKHTENKQAEEDRLALESQFRQAQKMESVGLLAGGVAHDFNNMLTVISGYSNLGLTEAVPSSPLAKYFEEILKMSERSAELTHQLLAFARKQVISPEVLLINEAVAGMLNMLQRLIGENIDLTLQPAEHLWLVKMDPSQIDQILANLCVNARDSIADVGAISIGMENVTVDKIFCSQRTDAVPGEYVRLDVCDTGRGMDKETLERIFEPFFTTKESGKGTGLGLATVFGIIKQNRGFIDVCSEPGKGTTFSLYLPRYAGTVNEVTAGGLPESPPRGNETILIVEDEHSILMMSAIILSRLGYTVLQASSPAAAIALAKNHADEIRLVITDVVMPGMNGRNLANELSALFPELLFLFMSGYTADFIGHHGVLDGNVNFIPKPFTLPSLAIKVRDVLDA
jgi:PAS domain S-box-containing protein